MNIQLMRQRTQTTPTKVGLPPVAQVQSLESPGLEVCEFVTGAKKLENAAKLINENHHYHPAKLRLELF